MEGNTRRPSENSQQQQGNGNTVTVFNLAAFHFIFLLQGAHTRKKKK
jgi:prophage maintenance system killer protein